MGLWRSPENDISGAAWTLRQSIRGKNIAAAHHGGVSSLTTVSLSLPRGANASHARPGPACPLLSRKIRVEKKRANGRTGNNARYSRWRGKERGRPCQNPFCILPLFIPIRCKPLILTCPQPSFRARSSGFLTSRVLPAQQSHQRLLIGRI